MLEVDAKIILYLRVGDNVVGHQTEHALAYPLACFVLAKRLVQLLLESLPLLRLWRSGDRQQQGVYGF